MINNRKRGGNQRSKGQVWNRRLAGTLSPSSRSNETSANRLAKRRRDLERSPDAQGRFKCPRMNARFAAKGERASLLSVTWHKYLSPQSVDAAEFSRVSPRELQ